MNKKLKKNTEEELHLKQLQEINRDCFKVIKSRSNCWVRGCEALTNIFILHNITKGKNLLCLRLKAETQSSSYHPGLTGMMSPLPDMEMNGKLCSSSSFAHLPDKVTSMFPFTCET